MIRKPDCPECQGRGETAVPGTYGPTISPERLELVPCWRCGGTGEYRALREEEQPDEDSDT